MKAVNYLGRQKRADGTSFLLVNEVDTNSTVAYDKKKHRLIRLSEEKRIKKQHLKKLTNNNKAHALQ